MTEKTSKPPTIEALASALGLSPRRISQLKKEGLPCETIEAAIAWRKANASTDSTEELRQRRIALLVAQERRVTLEADRLAGQFFPRGELLEAQGTCLAVLRSHLLKLHHELPPRLEGLRAAQIQAIIKGEIIGCLTRLSDDLAALATG